MGPSLVPDVFKRFVYMSIWKMQLRCHDATWIIFTLLFAFENPCSTSAPRWLVAYSINKMDFPVLKDPPGLLF